MGNSKMSPMVLPTHNTVGSIVNAKNGTYSIEYWFDEKKMPIQELPKRVDIRKRECFPYPVPKDQGSEGSCVTHAMSTAFICAQRKKDISVVNSKVPVVEKLFQNAREKSNVDRSVSKGITFSEAMKVLTDDAIWFRIGRDITNFKRCLSVGYPIVLGFAITKEMKKWQDNQQLIQKSEYVLPSTKKNDINGYHCVLLVGYDDEFRGGIFIARNSWGENWGYHGHFFFPYSLINDDNIILDAMVVDVKE